MSRQLSVSTPSLAGQRVRRLSQPRGLPASVPAHPDALNGNSILESTPPSRGRKQWENFQLPVREKLLPQFTGTENTASASKKRRTSKASYAWGKFVRKIGATVNDPMGDGSKLVPESMLRSFTSACVVNAGYRLDSFLTVYRRGIVEWLRDHDFTVPDDAMSVMSQQVTNLVNEGKVHKSQLKSGDSSKPMRSNDLDLIAASYPEGAADKVEVLAYLSLGNHTGARGVSADSAVWENMPRPVVVQGVAQVVHAFTTTKGSHEDSRLTVEGQLSDASGSNHVYWFREHVREQLGDPDAAIGDFVGKLRGSVFPRSRMDYSNRLRQVTEYTGYPSDFVFSLHSARSGFLADTVINFLLKNHSWMDAWQQAAIIGGWRDSDYSSQREYVKKQLQRIVVATRVRDGGCREKTGTEADPEIDGFFGNGPVALNMLTPENFHELPGPIVPCWPDAQKHTFMQAQVGNAAKTIEHTLNLPANDKARRWVYHEMKNLQFPTKSALAPYKDLVNDLSMRVSGRERAIMARWSLTNQGLSHRQTVRDLVAAATEEVLTQEKYRAKAEASSSTVKKQETYADVVKKKLPQRRVVWSNNEIQALLRGFLKYGKRWCTIATNSTLAKRTGGNCKDKMRTLCKQLNCTANDVLDKWLAANKLASLTEDDGDDSSESNCATTDAKSPAVRTHGRSDSKKRVNKSAKSANTSRQVPQPTRRSARASASPSAARPSKRGAACGGDSDSDSSRKVNALTAHEDDVDAKASSSSDSESEKTIKIKKEPTQCMKPLPVAPRGTRYVVYPAENAYIDSEDEEIISGESSFSDFEQVHNSADSDEQTELEEPSQERSEESDYDMPLAQPDEPDIIFIEDESSNSDHGNSSEQKHIRDVAASIAGAVDLELCQDDSDHSTNDSADVEYEPSEEGSLYSPSSSDGCSSSDADSEYEPSEDSDSSDGINIDFDSERRVGPVSNMKGVLEKFNLGRPSSRMRTNVAGKAAARRQADDTDERIGESCGDFAAQRKGQGAATNKAVNKSDTSARAHTKALKNCSVASKRAKSSAKSAPHAASTTPPAKKATRPSAQKVLPKRITKVLAKASTAAPAKAKPTANAAEKNVSSSAQYRRGRLSLRARPATSASAETRTYKRLSDDPVFLSKRTEEELAEIKSDRDTLRELEEDIRRMTEIIDANTRGLPYNSSDDFMSTPPAQKRPSTRKKVRRNTRKKSSSTAQVKASVRTRATKTDHRSTASSDGSASRKLITPTVDMPAVTSSTSKNSKKKAAMPSKSPTARKATATSTSPVNGDTSAAEEERQQVTARTRQSNATNDSLSTDRKQLTTTNRSTLQSSSTGATTRQEYVAQPNTDVAGSEAQSAETQDQQRKTKANRRPRGGDRLSLTNRRNKLASQKVTASSTNQLGAKQKQKASARSKTPSAGSKTTRVLLKNKQKQSRSTDGHFSEKQITKSPCAKKVTSKHNAPRVSTAATSKVHALATPNCAKKASNAKKKAKGATKFHTPLPKATKSAKPRRANAFTTPRKRNATHANASSGGPVAKVARKLSLSKNRTVLPFAVGCKVNKFFEECDAFFRGSIDRIGEESRTRKVLYHITYDDGDSEDLYSSEVAKCIAK